MLVGLQWAFKPYYLSICLSTIGIKKPVTSLFVGLQWTFKSSYVPTCWSAVCIQNQYFSICWSTKGVKSQWLLYLLVYSLHSNPVTFLSVTMGINSQLPLSGGLQWVLKANYLSICWSTVGMKNSSYRWSIKSSKNQSPLSLLVYNGL